MESGSGIWTYAFAAFAVLAVTLASSSGDACTGQWKLGRVVDVAVSPENVTSGDRAQVTLRVETPFSASAIWQIREDDGQTRNTFVVPDHGDGEIRSSFKKDGSIYTFTLYVHSFIQEAGYDFQLTIVHPCNVIMLNADINTWMNMTDSDLPTALAVPKAVVDLTQNDQETMKVGVNVDPGRTVYSYTFFRYVRRDDSLLPRNGMSSEDPIDVEWRLDTGEGRMAPHAMPHPGQDSIQGELTFSKVPKNIEDVKSMLLTAACQIEIGTEGSQHYLTIRTDTKVLLDATEKPAIGLFSYERDRNMLRSDGFYQEEDGTRVLPYVLDQPNIRLPELFECFAEAAFARPAVAVARIIRDERGVRVLDHLNGLMSDQGVSTTGAFQIYQVPDLAVGESAEYMCSAVNGDKESFLFFRLINTEPVKVASANASVVQLNADTFKNGLRFTCRVGGTPTPNVRFYKISKYSMDYPSTVSDVLEDNYAPELTGDRFKVETSDGEATLVVSPGPSPFPYDEEKFRIVCLAKNLYSGDVSAMNFITDGSSTTED